MRKFLMSSVLLLAVITAQGQTKITPTLQKGLVKSYQITADYQIPGMSTITTTADDTYTVTDATADGYIINYVSTNFKSTAAESDITGQILNAANTLLADLTITIVTDKDGKVLRIANYDELKKQLDVNSDKMVDKILAAAPPAAAQAMPKDTFKGLVMQGLSEDKLLKSLQDANSVLTLNGKTLSTGMQEQFINAKEAKMKRLYFVNGKDITCNAVLDMTTEEIKAVIIAKLTESMPEQADIIKQNIDQLIASGMLKFEMQENATYQLDADGWLKSIKVEDTANTMGQKTVITTTITVK